MPFRINHIHLKAPEPEKTANWYVAAFNLKIVSDIVRPTGDRFIRCVSEDEGMAVIVSGARTGETMGDGNANAHYGLEHFGFDTADIVAEIARLEGLGATLLEGPNGQPGATRTAFVRCPDDVRIELVQAASPT